MVLLHQVVAVGEKRHIELKSLGCFEKKKRFGSTNAQQYKSKVG